MTDREHWTVGMSGRFWRKNQLPLSFALLSVIGLAATVTLAVEDSKTLASVGLRGIFPSAPPADLSEEEFAKLDGNWAEWSKGAAAAVADFYSKLETSDAAAQRAGLDVLKIKLDVMRRALDDPRYKSLYGPLAALYNSLSLRIDLAQAALDTLESDGNQVAGRIASRGNELLSSISALERDLSSIGNGTLWLPYFKIDALKSALSSDPSSSAAIEAASRSMALMQGRDATLDDTQRQFTHRPSFDAFGTAVGRYLSAATWKNAPEATNALRNELKSISDALDTYSGSGQKASDVRHAFGRARFAAPDGGDRLASVLQKRLFNYNVRFLVTDEFMNKLMSQNRREVGPVSDFILGAVVSGCQITDTTVRVDLKPSNTTARFDLVLQGTINSDTQGVTPQATVLTHGTHTFIATKEVNFDGLNFSTLPATISIQPHNTTTGISTKFSRVPILGRVAGRIAAQQVQAKSPESTAITESRVRDGVLPRFNQEADSSFATEGAKLNNEVFGGLRAAGVFPDSYTYQTTDRLLTVNARVMGDDQIAADMPESSLMTTTGATATALFHESAINNSIDHIGFAGQTLTEPEVRAKIESFISKISNRPFKIEPPPVDPDAEEKRLNAIIFAPTDPLRVRIQDGVLTLTIRAGFKQEDREDIPMREVIVPLSFTVQGSQISIQRGNVIVRAAEGEGGGISVNAVVRKKIQSVLPDRVVNGNIVVTAPEKTVTLHISSITMMDGWAAATLD